MGHAIAYRVVGMPTDDLHGYLAHAPQIVLVLATVAILGLAVDSRARRRSSIPLASAAVLAFVAQEHLERLVHSGQLPFLLTSPVLWLGIALQIPFAAVVWVVVRGLAEDIAAPVRRTVPRVASFASPTIPHGRQPITCASRIARPARGPPVCA